MHCHRVNVNELISLVSASTNSRLVLRKTHGVPLRLVAPPQYGYKSLKHLARMSIHFDDTTFRPSAFRFMDHPRARVLLEERWRLLPGCCCDGSTAP